MPLEMARFPYGRAAELTLKCYFYVDLCLVMQGLRVIDELATGFNFRQHKIELSISFRNCFGSVEQLFGTRNLLRGLPNSSEI